MRKFLIAAILSLLPFAAQAQSLRAAVSLSGSDTNNCAVATPCRTFAAALAVIADKGQIICLNSAGFGGMVITKSVEIDCSAGQGLITAGGAGSNAIVISGSTPLTVSIRGVLISGINAGQNGIQMLAPGSLLLDNVRVHGFIGYGVNVEPASGNATVTIKDSLLSNNAGGNIFSKPSSSVVSFGTTFIDNK